MTRFSSCAPAGNESRPSHTSTKRDHLAMLQAPGVAGGRDRRGDSSIVQIGIDIGIMEPCWTRVPPGRALSPGRRASDLLVRSCMMEELRRPLAVGVAGVRFTFLGSGSGCWVSYE